MATPLRNLMTVIAQTIRITGGQDEIARHTIDIINDTDLSALDLVVPEKPVDEIGLLDHALAFMKASDRPDIAAVAAALDAAKLMVPWVVAEEKFYAASAEPGRGYRKTKMICELIGPDMAPAYAADFRLGLFLFGAKVLYRDHAHSAPELYIPLTGPTKWRRDCGDWEEYPAGVLLYNAPRQPHAMLTGDVPFFAIFAWLQNVHGQIEVVPMGDCEMIEASLAKQSESLN